MTGAGGGMRLVIKQLVCTVQGWSLVTPNPPPRMIESLVFLIALDVSFFGRDIYNLAGVFSRFPITFLVTRLAAHLTSYKLSYIYLTTF